MLSPHRSDLNSSTSLSLSLSPMEMDDFGAYNDHEDGSVNLPNVSTCIDEDITTLQHLAYKMYSLAEQAQVLITNLKAKRAKMTVTTAPIDPLTCLDIIPDPPLLDHLFAKHLLREDRLSLGLTSRRYYHLLSHWRKHIADYSDRHLTYSNAFIAQKRILTSIRYELDKLFIPGCCFAVGYQIQRFAPTPIKTQPLTDNHSTQPKPLSFEQQQQMPSSPPRQPILFRHIRECDRKFALDYDTIPKEFRFNDPNVKDNSQLIPDLASLVVFILKRADLARTQDCIKQHGEQYKTLPTDIPINPIITVQYFDICLNTTDAATVVKDQDGTRIEDKRARIDQFEVVIGFYAYYGEAAEVRYILVLRDVTRETMVQRLTNVDEKSDTLSIVLVVTEPEHFLNAAGEEYDVGDDANDEGEEYVDEDIPEEEEEEEEEEDEMDNDDDDNDNQLD